MNSNWYQQTRLALYEHDRDVEGRVHLGPLKTETERSFSHTDYSNLKSVFANFFEQAEIKQAKEEIYAICLSIAGPIMEKCFNLHGAPWAETEKEFCKAALTDFLFCPVPILFLNDMEAIGYSIFTLPQEELATLDIISLDSTNKRVVQGEKPPRHALMLVVEGLGQALWSWDEKRREYSPSPSEGGHADFAARNTEEIDLLKFFQNTSPDPRHSPISYEQVLSIGGLRKILAFVEKSSKQPLSPAFKQNLEKQPKEKQIELLAEAAINEAAINDNVICKKVWELFLSILGAQAGNIVLTYRADGGIYLTGFVLVELVKQLHQKKVAVDTFFAPFLKAFSYKEGVFADINVKTPVNIVCKSGLAMAGAAQHALPFVTKGFFEVNKKLAK